MIHRIKILIFLTLSILSLIVISCSRSKKNNHAKIIWEKYDNGNYKTVHQFFTDTADMSEDYYYQEFYENGTLKMQGLECQRVRKGEWKFFTNDGDLKAKLHYENGIINGTIELFAQDGTVEASDEAENGQFALNNDKVTQFVMRHFKQSAQRPNWHDSLHIMADSLVRILDNETPTKQQ